MDEDGRAVLPGLSYGAKRSRFAEGVSHFEAGVTPSSHGPGRGGVTGWSQCEIASNDAGGRRLFREKRETHIKGAEAHESAPQTPVVAAGKPNGGTVNARAAVK